MSADELSEACRGVETVEEMIFLLLDAFSELENL
jgi:hypothetical protein